MGIERKMFLLFLPIQKSVHANAGRPQKGTELLTTHLIASITQSMGYVVAQLVEALHYNSEVRGFDSRRFHWNFSLT